jgi:hypothetical protein
MRFHGADPEHVAAGWTEEASQIHRIGLEPHSIAVGTARSDIVDVTVQFHFAVPQADLDESEHIVEADLDVPGGDLAIYGPADDPGDELHGGSRTCRCWPGRDRIPRSRPIRRSGAG